VIIKVSKEENASIIVSGSILSLNAFSQYIVYNLHQDLLSNFLFVMMVRVLLFGVTSY
jgi:hypothetical protein